MPADLWALYRQMLRSRLFERAVARLWAEGAISGEMHLGIGEEGVAAGVAAHLGDGDAMALDHRGTPPLLMRGVEPVALLRELLGRRDGLCAGMGGHMHLFSPEHLAASSGIVGASGPAAVGFALAARHLRPGRCAVAFFGEGAANQGMLLEALNLAVAWRLGVLFVCKDNGWAITTVSRSVTGGSLTERAKAFGMLGVEVDGSDVEAVWSAAGEAIARARQGGGPTFLLAHCARPDGHFLGDLLLRFTRDPAHALSEMAWPTIKASLRPGGQPLWERVKALASVSAQARKLAGEQRARRHDPLVRCRRRLAADKARLRVLHGEVRREIEEAVRTALGQEVWP